MNKRYELYKTAHKNNPLIKYVFYSHDIDQLENCIKNLLRDQEYRNRKEFYLLELVDIVTAIKNCNDLITKFECKSCKKISRINKMKNHLTRYHNKNDKIRFYEIGKANKYN